MNYARTRVRRIVGRAMPGLRGLWYGYKEWRFRTMLDNFISDFGLVVQNGPFRGLKYLPESTGSSLLPKLLGTYEAALHPVLASVLQRPYDNVINIGCAEGYYAVGLAQRLPGVPVIAFDTNPRAREMCARLADLNGVTNQLTILGECTPEVLAGFIGNRSLIICDCEGYEAELLDPDLMEGLNRCDLIVELHPLINAAIPDLFEGRFKQSHKSSLVHAKREGNYQELKVFKWFDRRLATYEERSGFYGLWAVLMPGVGDSVRGRKTSVARQ